MVRDSEGELRKCPNCQSNPHTAASQDVMPFQEPPSEVLWVCGNGNCRVREYWGGSNA